MARLGKYTPLLRPIAWLYGVVVGVRNALFDKKLLPSESYPIPVISVGNITVGGTGKTPHVEYIISLLSPQYRVAVISRGYKRKTRGLVEAKVSSTAQEIGDEPQQIHLKYPEVRIVVDGNRRRAMRHLLALPEAERPQIVLLDDAMQHRYVQPSCSIMLMDSTRSILTDRLLPEGELREPASARYRADIIIATKCPEELSPIQQRVIERTLAPYPYQKIFFSRTRYHAPKALNLLGVIPSEATLALRPIPRQGPIIVLTGIAQPAPMLEYLKARYQVLEHLHFADHHNFSNKDLRELNALYQTHQERNTSQLYVLCTEKDAVRLWELRDQISPALYSALHYLPIEVEIIGARQEFERQIHLAARSLAQQHLKSIYAKPSQ